MKLRILGAAGEVTGSNYMIETGKYKILVDCGFYQGKDEEKHEGESFPFNPADIDVVLLTHAHIDHSGRIPLLVKEGFRGKVFCTYATLDLVDVLWMDSAKLMKEDAEWKSRKNARKGRPAVEPIYGDREAAKAVSMCVPVPYDEVINAVSGLKFRFREAGHILGSAVIETWVSEEPSDKTVKIVFSGDLGPLDGVIEKPPVVVDEADYVLIESTYGDRLHKSLEKTREEFQNTVKEALLTSAKILIPTFVVDRAQRMLYEFALLQKEFPHLKMPNIYLDSPMGVKTTEIYTKHISLLSRELKEMLIKGDEPFEPKKFHFVRTPDESRAINEERSGIILAGSGMCSGGRIMHHLKHNLFKTDTHVIFVGYQAYGTLGRRLVDGAKDIRIAGEDVTVNAQLHTLGGFSAHADRDDLLKWASAFPKKARFIVIHGEPKSSGALASALSGMGYQSVVPDIGYEIDLLKSEEFEKDAHIVPHSVLERISITSGDIEQILSSITTRSEEMQKAAFAKEDYKNIMPLLVSARTLLETAAFISKKDKKSA